MDRVKVEIEIPFLADSYVFVAFSRNRVVVYKVEEILP